MNLIFLREADIPAPVLQMWKKKERWTKKAQLEHVGGENHSEHPSFEVSYCQDEEKQLITFWMSPRSGEAFTSPVLEHHPWVGSLQLNRWGEAQQTEQGPWSCPLDFRLCACIGNLEKACHILMSLEGNIILDCNQVPECVCWRSWETGYQQRTAVQFLLEKGISEQIRGEYLFWKEWLCPATPWTLIAVVSSWRCIEHIGGEQNDE